MDRANYSLENATYAVCQSCRPSMPSPHLSYTFFVSCFLFSFCVVVVVFLPCCVLSGRRSAVRRKSASPQRQRKGNTALHCIGTHRSEHAHTENNSHTINKMGKVRRAHTHAHSNKERGGCWFVPILCGLRELGCGAASVSPQAVRIAPPPPIQISTHTTYHTYCASLSPSLPSSSLR